MRQKYKVIIIGSNIKKAYQGMKLIINFRINHLTASIVESRRL
jgi:hypothetical protein